MDNVFRLITASLFIGLCSGAEYKRVCYMSNWSQYRTGGYRFTAANITDVTLCTHYIFAFANVLADQDTLGVLEWNDDIPGGNYEQFVGLREKNKDAKFLLAVGGWTHGVIPFIQVAYNNTKVERFCDNVIKYTHGKNVYLRDRNFDGIDLDWEYPAHRGGADSDRERFTYLLDRMMQKFKEEAASSGKPRLLLTSAVPAPNHIAEKAYEIEKIAKIMDFINLMTYDFDVRDISGLYHLASLYSVPGEVELDAVLNMNGSVQFWLSKGAPRDKLVVGMPIYGREYTRENTGPFVYGEPMKVNSTRKPVWMSKMCQRVRQGWTLQYDNVSKAATMMRDNLWVTYDNMDTVKEKTNYVKDQQLGGVMVWELSVDDFGGNRCNKGPFQYINKYRQILSSARDDCPPGSWGKVDEHGCTPCKPDTYQEASAQISCLSCPAGFSTRSTGTDARYKCRKFCYLGEEYDYVTQTCVKCRLNYFRSDMKVDYCLKCAPGMVTAHTGSTDCVQKPEGVAEPKTQQTQITVTTRYKATSCENLSVLVGAIHAQIKQSIQNMGTTWRGVCDQSCNNMESSLKRGCETDESAEMAKKDDNKVVSVDTIIYQVPQDISGLENGQSVTRSADSLILQALFDRQQFSDLSRYGASMDGVTDMKVTVLCHLPGHVYKDDICVPCDPGTFFDPMKVSCIACPKGTYQSEAGQIGCMKCPTSMITEEDGATSKDKCIAPCDADENYCNKNGICRWHPASSKVYCECRDGYYGDKCQVQRTPPPDYRTVIGASIGGSLALLVFIMLVVGCCIYCRYRNKKEVYTHRTSEGKTAGVSFQDYLDYKMWKETGTRTENNYTIITEEASTSKNKNTIHL